MDRQRDPDWIGSFLMRRAPRLLEPGRLDTVVATLLLLGTLDSEVRKAALKNVWTDRCHIDARLVSDLYRVCPRHLKPRLASSAAVTLLDPRTFRRIFEDVYALPLSAVERRDVASALGTFLRWKPREAPRYRSVILELLRSRQVEPSMIAVNLTAYIPDLGHDDLEVIRRKLSSRHFQTREAALLAFFRQMQQHRAVTPEVLAYCTSERVMEKVRRLRRSDPDRDVRLYAKQTLEGFNKLLRERPAVRARVRQEQKEARPTTRRQLPVLRNR